LLEICGEFIDLCLLYWPMYCPETPVASVDILRERFKLRSKSFVFRARFDREHPVSAQRRAQFQHFSFAVIGQNEILHSLIRVRILACAFEA
jgi:hypothetical protein